ncbi:tetratricopeptide repeat protein [Leuconostoc citreum]|uniref:tetratricopeptide repeat protein n=1 Tax=Leuconostoc citreum TaxID=33964 RepID=UPI000BFF124A|nr:tetratricopeptide repeat protein [Leuconostoc citreum]
MEVNYAQEMSDALSQGQMDAAQSAFAKSLRQDSDELIYSLAEELYALGFLNQSRRAYKKLLAKYPDEDDIRTALADIAIEDGEVDEAQNYLAQIKPDSPAYLQALLVKADIYQAEGLTESAEYSLLQAEDLAPEEIIIQFALAEFYYANLAYQKAIPRYRKLLLQGEREISRVDIVARLGVAYAAVGNYDNAIGYLEQIKPQQMTLDTQFQLAVLYQETNREEEAIKLFNAILDSDPKYTSIYPLLGQSYERLQQPEEAFRVYQAGLIQDEMNTKLYHLAGHAAEKSGDDTLAEAYYQKALSIDESDTTALFMLADLYLQHNQYAQALSLLEKENKEIEDERFNWYLARIYQAIGDDGKAKQYWQEATPLFQENSDFMLDLINWYHEQGQPEAEIEALQRYLFLVPDDLDMQMRLEDLAY